jgi:hypothetical protein
VSALLLPRFSEMRLTLTRLASQARGPETLAEEPLP